MYLGMLNGKVCLTSADSPNNSVCVTGISGTGKTSRLNQIELVNAKEETTVIVIDLNQTHIDNKIFPCIRTEYIKKVNRIHVMQDGLGMEFLRAMQICEGRKESSVHLINSAVKAISASQKMGARQIGVLRQAIIWAIEHREEFNSEADAITASLKNQTDREAEAVYQKLWPLLNSRALVLSSKTIETNAINIIDLSGIDSITQSVLTEMILSNLWRKIQFENTLTSQKNLMIVLDEFQHI